MVFYYGCWRLPPTFLMPKAQHGFWWRITNRFLGCTRFGWTRGRNKGEMHGWNTAISLNVIGKPPGQKGCAVIPKRWVAEHSIAWAGRNRLARKAYNRNPESSEAFLYPGSIAMFLSRLYPRCSFLITLSGTLSREPFPNRQTCRTPTTCRLLKRTTCGRSTSRH